MATYDPTLVHYWDEVRPRGEWPTTVIAPVCTPSEQRTVLTSMADDQSRTSADPRAGGFETANLCPVCVEVMDAVAASLVKAVH